MNPSYRRRIGHIGPSVISYDRQGMFLMLYQEWWILCVLWWSCSSTGQLPMWTLHSFYNLFKGYFYSSFLWLVCNSLLVAKLLFQKGHSYPQSSPHSSTLVYTWINATLDKLFNLCMKTLYGLLTRDAGCWPGFSSLFPFFFAHCCPFSVCSTFFDCCRLKQVKQFMVP